MKVRALNSFSDSVHGSRAAGDEFWLPVGVDWLSAGLVEAVGEPEDVLESGSEIDEHFADLAPEPPAPKPARKKAKGG